MTNIEVLMRAGIKKQLFSKNTETQTKIRWSHLKTRNNSTGNIGGNGEGNG